VSLRLSELLSQTSLDIKDAEYMGERTSRSLSELTSDEQSGELIEEKCRHMT